MEGCGGNHQSKEANLGGFLPISHVAHPNFTQEALLLSVFIYWNSE